MINQGPAVPKKEGTVRWLYELLRKLGGNVRQAQASIIAIGRGELPDGSGKPLPFLDDYLFKPGLPSGQKAYGGVNAGENLTFGSTKGDPKGHVNLTADELVTVDEEAVRVGIYETDPDARLHIHSGGGVAYGYFRPTASGQTSISAPFAPVGAATMHEAVDDTGEDSVASPGAGDYVRYTGGISGSTLTLTFSNLGVIDPGVDTGFVFHVTMRATDTAHQFLSFDMESHAVPIFSTGSIVWAASPTFVDPVFPVGSLKGTLTTSFVRYTYALSPAEAANIDFNYDLIINIGTNITASLSDTLDIAQIELEFPPAGGAGIGDTLQKWEYTTDSNELAYALDANNDTVLALTGTPALAVQTDEFQITIGTPTVGYPWVSTDVDTGTGAWTDPYTLHTKYDHEWIVNGPYQTGVGWDCGRIPATSGTIKAVWLSRLTAGTASSTILDLNRNGTTMYTTQGNRPTIAFNDSDNKVLCTLPDVTSFTAGDVLTMDIDQIEDGDPLDVALIVEVA